MVGWNGAGWRLELRSLLSPAWPVAESESIDLRPCRGRQAQWSGLSRRGPDCAVMITAGAAAENTVPAVLDVADSAGAPALAEPVWPWVSWGSSEDGRGVGGAGPGRLLHAPDLPPAPQKDAPIRTLVQRIHQLQDERAQGFRKLEE